MWHGAVGRTYLLSASFVWRCLSGSAMTPFPHPLIGCSAARSRKRTRVRGFRAVDTARAPPVDTGGCNVAPPPVARCCVTPRGPALHPPAKLSSLSIELPGGTCRIPGHCSGQHQCYRLASIFKRRSEISERGAAHRLSIVRIHFWEEIHETSPPKAISCISPWALTALPAVSRSAWAQAYRRDRLAIGGLSHAERETAGSAQAPTARCRNCLRGEVSWIPPRNEFGRWKAGAQHPLTDFRSTFENARQPIALMLPTAMTGISARPAGQLYRKATPTSQAGATLDPGGNATSCNGRGCNVHPPVSTGGGALAVSTARSLARGSVCAARPPSTDERDVETESWLNH